MSCLLAPDLCRHILVGRPRALLRALQRYGAESGEVTVSALTLAELVSAALASDERDRHCRLVEEFRQRLHAVVPWDAAALDAYADVREAALRQGVRLHINDAMLAAHALSLNAELWTLDGSPFDRINGLSLKVWE